MSQAALPSPMAATLAWRLDPGRREKSQETVARETPLEIRLNGRAHTLVMASPTQLEDLAWGFCRSEGLVRESAEMLEVRLGQSESQDLGAACWIDISLPPELARRAKVRRLAPALTSCGLCGLESLEQLSLDAPPPDPERPPAPLSALGGLFHALERAQVIFPRTGGTHAAAVGGPQGQVWGTGEDVGRHNALDKALGMALRAGHDLRGGLAALSGRVSFEMAAKAARVGLAVVGSVSAPTALSVSMLERLGLSLVAFWREGRCTVYTHPERLLVEGRPLEPLPEEPVQV